MQAAWCTPAVGGMSCGWVFGSARTMLVSVIGMRASKVMSFRNSFASI